MAHAGPAAAQLTDAEVDAAAKVIWESERSYDDRWDDADNEQRAAYRHIARKALAAAARVR